MTAGFDRRSFLSSLLTYGGLAVAIAGLYAAIVVGARVATGRVLDGGEVPNGAAVGVGGVRRVRVRETLVAHVARPLGR